MIERTHKIRLYPNKDQEKLLIKTVGIARFAYNWGISMCRDAYEKGTSLVSAYALRREWTTNHPKWAEEVAPSCIYRSFMHVEAAYKAFFRRRDGNAPRFHKKGRHDSFHVANDKAVIKGSRIRIPGIGYIRMAEQLRYTDATIKSYTIKLKNGIWFVMVHCTLPDIHRVTPLTIVGVDVGIKTWAVSSDGTSCTIPDTLLSLTNRQKKAQHDHAKKQQGSRRCHKCYNRLSKINRKIHNIKLDTIHKFTATIAKNHGVVVVEDLSVKDMQTSKIKGIRKGVTNSMMSEILRQLKYKCNHTVVVDRYFPSSKTCSNCGNVKDDLTLSDRTYHCPSCGHTMDRDMNAAVNLRNEGLKIIYAGSQR